MAKNNLKIRWKKRPSRVLVYMNHVHGTTRSAKRILLGKTIKKPTISSQTVNKLKGKTKL